MTDLTELVLRQSRKKAALVLLGSCVFVALGVMMTFDTTGSSRYSPEVIHLIGWGSILFFGLTALASVYGLIKPAEVILSVEGFRVNALRSRDLVPWTSVDRFFITQIRSTRIVSYDLKPEVKSALQRAGATSGRSFGYGDGAIPAHLTVGADEVLGVMEGWRVRYGL